MKKIIKRMLQKDVIKNIFKTNYERNILICYIVEPFLKNYYTHTNYAESILIAKAFNELEYNVDVIDYLSNKILTNKYDVVFGFGNSYANHIFNNSYAIKIAYGTGAHNCYQNNAEIERIKEVYLKKRFYLQPRRIINKAWSIYASLSDAMILIGNKTFTMKTFEHYVDCDIYLNVLPLNGSLFHREFNRDYKKAKYHFLWFGSSGLVHKGLDLCLDFFSKNDQYHLHICGQKESDFFIAYKDELQKSNITYHGFLDINSEIFEQIAKQCSFVISPSCSEGMSGSVLTAMATGLIPIASNQNGIDKINLYGFEIENNICSIRSAVEESVKLNTFELEHKAQEIRKYIQDNFSEQAFYDNFKMNISFILKGEKK